jgi:arylsulfatase A-like enzyme
MARPNILFLPVDDLRPQLACYGEAQMISPHIDRLAETGVTFRQAYCQVPVCGASRASLLSGVRPRHDRFLDFATWTDEDRPGVRTLPQHFRENGYRTVSVGKVFHHASDTAERSWSREPWLPPRRGTWRDYQLERNQAIEAKEESRGAPFECAEVPDNAYGDGKIADQAIAELHRLKDAEEPFFLAAGFLKPHLPFNAPRTYWDMYADSAIELAENPYRPQNAPDQAMHNFGELRSYFDVPREGPVPDELAYRLVHGYYAATSYMDAQVGRVLQSLEELGLAENTVVLFWGDHGWQLGEHGLWCKHCNFDTSLHAPLIVRAPDGVRDRTCGSLVEFVDIYPTLCELAGLELPAHLQGESMVPFLSDPSRQGKEEAFSRFGAGESIRAGRYLYTEWLDEEGAPTARMLYDHEADPDENVNIAEAPEHAEVVADLSERLHRSIAALE